MNNFVTKHRKVMRNSLRLYGPVLAAGLVLAPAIAFGQSSGSAPVLGKAVGGQSAGGVERTLLTAVNYVSNVLGPLASGGFFLHALLAWHNGGKPMRSVLTGVGLLGVSQALRLAEWFVNTGQNSSSSY